MVYLLCQMKTPPSNTLSLSDNYVLQIFCARATTTTYMRYLTFLANRSVFLNTVTFLLSILPVP